MSLRNRAVRTTDASTDVDQSQSLFRNAQQAQGDILCDGEVLAVTGLAPQGLERAGPIVLLLPDDDVVVELDAAIEEMVDPGELIRLGNIPAFINQPPPGPDHVARLIAEALAGQALHPVEVGICACEPGQRRENHKCA
ncbi:hypothetical protein SDC9_193479 [bioreactor metagenome]|uniref:Uncharacterized protein n=1 Tax=bioreactor metagenome TaxID=1076179 RepID=A0A645I458_9ZZZZ